MTDRSMHAATLVGILLIIWSGIFLFSVNHLNPFYLLYIIGVPFLMLVPGFLAYMSMPLSGRGFWGGLALSLPLSILLLMLTGLITNVILPRYFEIAHPLDKNALLISITILLLTLMAVFYKRVRVVYFRFEQYAIFDNVRDVLYALTPVVFITLSVFGAIRLNNGAENMLTMLSLVGIGIYVLFVVRELNRGREFDKNVIPIGLFLTSLSLLLMTSLRGWYTTGHDVQLEYRVFELTHRGGIWLIDNFKDAYNACMSITILPTEFAAILNIPDQYVYKVLFQIMFATLPAMIFLTVKRYTSTVIAFIATMYFVAFPTFFGDMPMLNRQEIAFIFLGAMVYILFDASVPFILRQVIFTLLGTGMVLSHYSTTYTVIGLLLFVLITRPLIHGAHAILIKKGWFKDAGVEEISEKLVVKKHVITYTATGILMLASFLWSSVLTDTSSGSLTRVILKTFAVIKENSKEDMRSSDVFYSLFTWGRPDPSKALANFTNANVVPLRALHPESYYDNTVMASYPIVTAPERSMPLTWVGKYLEHNGHVNIQNFNYIFRQSTARVLQILILIGFVSILVRSRWISKKWELDYMLLALGSLFMVVSQVSLPVLSAEYGVLRAFQQSLMFLGMLVVIGSLALFVRTAETKRIWFAACLAITFLYSTTGVFTQILGGYPAQLHLANDGSYYDYYYTHRSELEAVDWLAGDASNVDRVRIQTDRFEYEHLHTIVNADITKGIFPSLIERDAYIFLGFENTQTNMSTVSWNSDAIRYLYPIEFLDANKDLLYNNGQAKIYK